MLTPQIVPVISSYISETSWLAHCSEKISTYRALIIRVYFSCPHKLPWLCNTCYWSAHGYMTRKCMWSFLVSTCPPWAEGILYECGSGETVSFCLWRQQIMSSVPTKIKTEYILSSTTSQVSWPSVCVHVRVCLCVVHLGRGGKVGVPCVLLRKTQGARVTTLFQGYPKPCLLVHTYLLTSHFVRGSASFRRFSRPPLLFSLQRAARSVHLHPTNSNPKKEVFLSS